MNESRVDGDILSAVLGALSDVVLLVGEDRKIHFINRTEAGRSVGEIVGSDAIDDIPPEDQADATAALDRVFETGEPVQRMTEIVGADGESQHYEGTLFPVVRDGRVAYVAIVSANVTERVRAERELSALERLVPLCAWCRKKVRNDDGEWTSLEEYIQESGGRHVTHAMCPDCEDEALGDLTSRGA